MDAYVLSHCQLMFLINRYTVDYTTHFRYCSTVLQILKFRDGIKDNLPESLMFSTRTSKKNNKDGKQCAEFIDRKVFKNALILRKCGVYSLCPGHEASTDVFDCDSVHFWSTHLLHHLHCLLRVVTQLTDHVHWRETGKCLRSHSIYYVEHGHIINPDWIRRLS